MTRVVDDLIRYIAGFREILHKAIHEGLEEGVDEVQANGARQLQEGWMHIHGASLSHSPWLNLTHCHAATLADERNIPPLGRIGDPDDIIASVRVQGGKVGFITIDTEMIES